MKLLLSNPRGFCAGVIRAIDTVERALELWGSPVFVKHHIVHNRHVVQRLEAKGAVFVDHISQIPVGSRVIYSAHGVSPSVRMEAKTRNLIEIDASCGLVIRVHSAVKRFASKGYHILLIGHKNHVEVIGTAGQAPDQLTVIESLQDIEALTFPNNQPLFYITQTTLSLDDVRVFVQALQEKYPNIKTLPTSSICYATTNRQLALKSIMDQVDCVLVIGDSASSNSQRLCELVKQRGVSAYLINDADVIDSHWFHNVSTVGLTAGASTPEDVVQSCIARLEQLGVTDIEDINYTDENMFFSLPKEVLI